MRIVGGEFGGRPLAAPRSRAIRPTSDRTRESLFNILAHSYPETVARARVLELFAGTGAVALEALSRGAAAAIFVEQSVEGRALIQSNIESLGLQGRTKIFRRDATALGQCQRMQPFTFVFADPPYGKGLGEKALASALAGGWVTPGALVLLEERSDVLPQPDRSLNLLESRVFGETSIHFYRHEPD
ncbi:16S rRNA (guanine(966)-N(2))-methyltransferase RsmD [Pararhizobium haloflavum]|uniref:16S rRNA (guanine(966)-N(2))-methyltransferase RsmD n=1 Tax=Pararhizobium haloflavum TaxID=2037914 RepID=UPI000C19C5B8|nr:16S rRNA (guanine(966)-N(2))-methyltransferase RsmD [Pararhizobium haloflavum]